MPVMADYGPESAQVRPETSITKEISVVVEAVDTRKSMDSESQSSDQRWTPGFWRRFPWLGIGGLLTVVLCSVAALVTLQSANDKPASEWLQGRLAPNVLLSIFNSISSLAMALAVGQGIAINWWRRALNGGTVKQLHYAWTFSTGISNIFKKVKYFNLIALAVLMTKIAVIDGILYQKAIASYLDIIRGTKHNETLQLFAAREFPTTARMGPTQGEHGLTNFAFDSQILHWDATGVDIDENSDVAGCYGADCHYYLQGVGFSMVCDSSSTTVDYGLVARATANQSTTSDAGLTNLPLFSIDFTRNWPSTEKNYSYLTLDMIYSYPVHEVSPDSEAVCPTTSTTTSCELRPALLNYKVQYTNGSTKSLYNQRHGTDGVKDTPPSPTAVNTTGLVATLNSHPSGNRLDYNCSGSKDYFEEGCGYYDPAWNQVKGVNFLRHADIIESFSPNADSALEGFYLAFRANLVAQSTLSYVNNSWSVDSDGMMAIASHGVNPDPDSCSYTFYDPMDLVMQSVNTLTLMTIQNKGLYYDSSDATDFSQPIGGTDPANADRQSPVAVVHYEDIFYSTNNKYMYAALAATIVVVICIAPVFWGFWELGRQVSLGPLEIANAFQGPAFARVQGDGVDEVLKSVGRQKVIYGQLTSENGQRLGFKIA